MSEVEEMVPKIDADGGESDDPNYVRPCPKIAALDRLPDPLTFEGLTKLLYPDRIIEEKP